MKKIERAQQFVNDHMKLFRCPVCHASLDNIIGTSVVCHNHHVIDFNKHGYLHLLNNNGGTEYDRQMFVDRRQLLSAGLFKPIIQKIAANLPERPLRILDVGTGEGTPLMQLAEQRYRQDDTMVGFDIAKAGIQLATQLPFAGFFCIADLRNLPFANNSFDIVMELFSPSDYQEFERVIVPGGELIKIIPNSNYLIELRHLLYGQADRHYHYDNQRVLDLFCQHYPLATVTPVKYQFAIPAGLQRALIGMTPLHWGKGAAQLSDEDLQHINSVTVDISILRAKIS